MSLPSMFRDFVLHTLGGANHVAPASADAFDRFTERGDALAVVVALTAMAYVALPLVVAPLRDHRMAFISTLFVAIAIALVPLSLYFARTYNDALREDGFTSVPLSLTMFTLAVPASAANAVFVAGVAHAPLALLAALGVAFVVSLPVTVVLHEKVQNTLYDGVDADACVIRDAADDEGQLLFASESRYEAYADERGVTDD